MTTSTHEPEITGPTQGLVDTAQYGLAAFLAVVGGVIVFDATTLDKGFADQPVQPYAFPFVVGGALIALAVLLAVATARGSVPQADEGEDIDLTVQAEWMTIAKLVAVFVANMLLIGWLGWAISGALLFAGSAYVLGSPAHVRNLAIGFALSLGTWYGFYSGLGIPIPAGILDGVL